MPQARASSNVAFDPVKDIGPQKGPQEHFLNSSADITIFGGAAGGGKTYALLIEPLRHRHISEFGAVIFRRDSVQINSEGGLFDTSYRLYSRLKAKPRHSPHKMWTFPSGATVSFNHLHNEKDVNDWQGSQIPLMCYDELTHFTANQFWYMLSRNRSTCGVRPYVRATCNPDADSWVAELLEWWINPDTGYPIPQRSGVIRWLVRRDDKTYWYGSKIKALYDHPDIAPKSFTFIASKLEDNKILVETDPGYRANLQAMNRVEQERLLYGNWKIRPQDASYFPSTMVGMLDTVPTDVMAWVRRWDLAATEPSEANPSPDSTASVMMGKRNNGRIVIADAINVKRNAHIVREIVKNVAHQDREQYPFVTVVVPQDAGQAGKEQAANYVAHLHGFNVHTERETGPKQVRAEPLSAQWQAGNVDIVKGEWNKHYLTEMEGFPSAAHDDYVDASSGAYLQLILNDSKMREWIALSE